MLHLLDSVSTRRTSTDQQKCCLEFLALTWNRLLSLAMYPSTTLLSVQKYPWSMVYSSSRCNCWLILTEHTAAVSLRRGIVTGLSGATLSNELSGFRSRGASNCTGHNPWHSRLRNDGVVRLLHDQYHLGIVMRWTSHKYDLHFSPLTLSGIGSSQPTSWRHNSWRIDFPSNKSGATNPSGSKIELTVESIPRLVHGLSCSTMANWKQSDSTHLWTPNARSKGSKSKSRSNSFLLIFVFALLFSSFENGMIRDLPRSWAAWLFEASAQSPDLGLHCCEQMLVHPPRKQSTVEPS